jgi:hypothetical protein
MASIFMTELVYGAVRYGEAGVIGAQLAGSKADLPPAVPRGTTAGAVEMEWS